MNNYDLLAAYAPQLTGDPTESRSILEQTIKAAIALKIAPDKLHQFLLVTIRNKCYDYNREREDPEVQAAALGVSIGCLQQEKRAIREFRFI
jgi:hypothetical protein